MVKDRNAYNRDSSGEEDSDDEEESNNKSQLASPDQVCITFLFQKF